MLTELLQVGRVEVEVLKQPSFSSLRLFKLEAKSPWYSHQRLVCGHGHMVPESQGL